MNRWVFPSTLGRASRVVRKTQRFRSGGRLRDGHLRGSLSHGAWASWLIVWGSLFGVSPVAAHDMWLQPTHFAPTVGEVVGLGLWLGHAGDAEGFARRDDHVARFEATSGDQSWTVPGQPGHEPAGYLKTSVAGLHTVVYESHGTVSELAADRFDAYLVEEGLDEIRAWRRGHGEANQPGREQYRRSLKSLVRVGSMSRSAEDQAVGLPLEFVLASPAEAKPALIVGRLLWQGEALPGALVELQPLDAMDTAARTARTDADGRVSFASVEAGDWMLTAVHMERATPANEDWEWQTTFATLTFALGGSAEPSS